MDYTFTRHDKEKKKLDIKQRLLWSLTQRQKFLSNSLASYWHRENKFKRVKWIWREMERELKKIGYKTAGAGQMDSIDIPHAIDWIISSTFRLLGHMRL